MAFKRVASLQEIREGTGLRVMLDALEIGLYRVGDAYYAMENMCPHMGYPLSDGELEGYMITCPGHGWEFNVVTGLAPGEVQEPPLARYPVRIEGDEVLIDVDSPL